MPDPIDNLRQAMLGRASDLAHRMLQHGIEAVVADGVTTNGHPCTVIIAIGDAADVARQVGAALVEKVERERAAQAARATRN